VFPGGSQHADDDGFGDPDRATAVRELFEEVGVLLARRQDGGFARDRDCERLRAALSGGASFPHTLAACELAPAFDRLTFLARWITPVPLRRRFDTRFYLARHPAAQAVCPHPGEVEDLIWITPAGALDAGGPAMVHATRRILESVAGEPDPARLVARLRRRRHEPPPVTPVVERLPDGSGFRVIGALSSDQGTISATCVRPQKTRTPDPATPT
jgi:8-oxo-dGTP pyrophosphatase MutT (NUDIX family)